MAFVCFHRRAVESFAWLRAEARRSWSASMAADSPLPTQATRGITSNGVPFVALPPDSGRDAAGVVVLWHGADPPRTEEALAGAVPLRGLAAWRIYFGMPGHGSRMPAGGFDEIMR